MIPAGKPPSRSSVRDSDRKPAPPTPPVPGLPPPLIARPSAKGGLPSPRGIETPSVLPPPIAAPVEEASSSSSSSKGSWMASSSSSSSGESGGFVPKKPSSGPRVGMLQKTPSFFADSGKLIVKIPDRKKDVNIVIPADSKGHTWKETFFSSKPCWCDFCERFLWQEIKAVGCDRCQYHVHGDCIAQVREICEGEDRHKRRKAKTIRQNTGLILDGAFRYSKMMNEPSFADVFFDYPNGVSLPAHSFVLNYRCQKLGQLVEDIRKKKQKGFFKAKKEQIPIHFSWTLEENCSPDSMQIILHFIYADNTDFKRAVGNMPLNCIAEVWKYSREWDLGRLELIMIAHHRKTLGASTVFELMKHADKEKAAPLKKQCMGFAHSNLQEFISQKDKASILGVDLFQEVIEAFYDQKVELDQSEVTLPPCSLVEDLLQIYCKVNDGSEFSDGYVELDGQRVVFNKAILAAYSRSIGGAMKASAAPENCTNILIAEDLKASAFQAALSYFYCGNTDLLAIDACNLVTFCKKFGLDDLLSVCEKQMKENMTHEVIFDILAVVFDKSKDSEGMRILEKSALDYAASNFEYLDLPQLRKLDQELSSEIMYRLLTTLQIAPPQLRMTRKQHSVSTQIGCFGVVGDEIWAGAESGEITVFKRPHGDHVADLQRQHTARLRSIISVSRCSQVWTLSEDGKFFVWDVRTRQTVKRFDSQHVGRVYSALIVPGQGLLAAPNVWTGGIDGYVNVWDVSTQQVVNHFEVHFPILCMCVADGGVWFGSKGVLGFVPLSGGEPTLISTNDGAKVSNILFTSSGELWAFSHAGNIFVVDSASAAITRTLQRHRSKIVAVAKTGNLVWSASADAVMICWKDKTYEVVRILRGAQAAAARAAVCGEEAPPCVWTSTGGQKLLVWKKD